MLIAIDENSITVKFPCIRTRSFFPVISSKSPVARLASHTPERHSSNDTLSGGKKNSLSIPSRGRKFDEERYHFRVRGRVSRDVSQEGSASRTSPELETKTTSSSSFAIRTIILRKTTESCDPEAESKLIPRRMPRKIDRLAGSSVTNPIISAAENSLEGSESKRQTSRETMFAFGSVDELESVYSW